MKPLLLTLGRMPEPAGVDDVPGEHAERLRSQVREHYRPHPRDGEGDREDYWEMAARLDAALHSGAPVWLYREGDSLVEPIRSTGAGQVLFHEAVGWEEVASGDFEHYGPLTMFSHGWKVVDQRADRYAFSEVFRRHAGRRVAFAGVDLGSDSTASLGRTMARWAADGHEEVIVKATRAKHGLWRLPTSPYVDVNDRAVFEAMDFSTVYLGGYERAFLMQEVVEMRHEWRAFVVDGEVVTGAGCVEHHTPLDAVDGEPYSPLVECHRRVSPVHRDVLAMDRLLDKAREFAADARDEMPRAYVVDVAESTGGRTLVIECNGLSNAGLYASHPRLVTQALVRGDRPTGR